MNLVNELENDLVWAFLIEKQHSEKIDSKEVVALVDRVREVLQPLSTEEEQLAENFMTTTPTENFLPH